MVHAVPVLLAAAGPGAAQARQSAQVRQSAAYGLGVLAQLHPSGFTPVAGQAVQALLSMLPTSNGDRHAAPTQVS